MTVKQLKDGRWYYSCKSCGKLPELMDSKEQAEAADALHRLQHKDMK